MLRMGKRRGGRGVDYMGGRQQERGEMLAKAKEQAGVATALKVFEAVQRALPAQQPQVARPTYSTGGNIANHSA